MHDDDELAALTGLPRAKLRAAAEHGFPLLPSGCAVHLDAVAREQVLASLRRSLGAGLRRLADELSELSAAQPAGAPPLDLTGYLRESGRELGEVYTEHFGWRAVERAAGRPGDDDRDEHSRRLGRLVHADDPAYLATMAQPGASAGEAQVQARGTCQSHPGGLGRANRNRGGVDRVSTDWAQMAAGGWPGW